MAKSLITAVLSALRWAHWLVKCAVVYPLALLTLMVCSSAGERVKRFWPRQFFVMFYAVHLAVLGIVVSM